MGNAPNQPKKIIIHHTALGHHTSKDPRKCDLCCHHRTESDMRKWIKSLKFQVHDDDGKILDSRSAKHIDHEGYITLRVRGHYYLRFIIEELGQPKYIYLLILHGEKTYYRLQLNYTSTEIVLTKQTPPNGNRNPSKNTKHQWSLQRD